MEDERVERGRLTRQHDREIVVDYVGRGLWFNGVPSYFELIDVREPLEPNEVVELRRPDGSLYKCIVLDSTRGCEVLATL
jgi:hypothetical protein